MKGPANGHLEEGPPTTEAATPADWRAGPQDPDMSINVNSNPFVSPGSQTISIPGVIGQIQDGADRAYLTVNADYAKYTTASTGAVGSFTGNGNTLALAQGEMDFMREASITFRYDAASGRYLNNIYGDVRNLTFTSSASPGDITDVNVYSATARTPGISRATPSA